MGVDLGVLAELVADVAFQILGDVVAAVSAISPSTSRSMLTVSRRRGRAR